MNTPKSIKITKKATTPVQRQHEFQSKVIKTAGPNAVRIEFKNNRAFAFFPKISQPVVYAQG